MSSSDSDDDCYGNTAQKLQLLKNKFDQEKIEDITLNATSEETNLLYKNDAYATTIVVEDFNTTLNSTDNEELSLDAIIAKNSKGKRGRKRKTNEDSFEPIYERETRSSRRKTSNNASRGKGKGNNSDKTGLNETSVTESSSESSSRGRSSSNTTRASASRSRGRGNSRGSTPSRGRGRGNRNRTPRRGGSRFQYSYPIYSVGNTDEYPDMCDNQELFSTNTNTKEVEIIENDPLETDNEELSVKVYWQNLEIVRFKLRKYQKLFPIFEYFSNRENVGNDKLLFMYNDRIIKVDDTPDTINYSIAKFIDGGIVTQNVSGLTKRNSIEIKNGLKLKFQCQNLKKPFETVIGPEDTMGLALLKCAEHLDTPVDRLKFYFDGDLISSKSTPRELDLEGGECIDVKFCS